MSRSLRDFYKGLASLLRAGVVLGDALGMLRRDRATPESLAAPLETAVGQGKPLATALADHPGRVPLEDVALIEAGESTGRLVEMLDRLGSLYDKRLEARRKLIRDSLYPFALFHFAALMLPVARLGVAGRLSAGRWIAQVLLILVPVYGLVFLIIQLNRAASWRERFRKIVSALPGFGNASRRRRRAVFATVLNATYEAGIRLDRCVALAGRAAGIEGCDEAARIVAEGQPLTVALGGRGILSPIALSRLATGETAGELSAALQSIAAEEGEAADAIFSAAMGALSKLIYILVALWIAWSVIWVYFNFYGQVL